MKRSEFIRMMTLAGLSFAWRSNPAGKRLGIIGLDTSHSVAFTKALNTADGYKIVAAYPKGSNDIPSSVNRIPAYTEEVKKLGVQIVNSIQELLPLVDGVLLETNDGRLHKEQALEVIKARKPLFIDKPVATSLRDAIIIYDTAAQYKVPVFSSSTLRYINGAQQVVKGKIGKVLGADTYSPSTNEKTHPDFFWYGIHGVELLYTVMGTGCKEVRRVATDDTDLVAGIWVDGRIGSFRGTRTGQHEYGGTVYGEKGNITLGPFEGYNALLLQIIQFFETGIAPVTPAETLEIIAFMEAANESKARKGKPVSIENIMKKSRK
jgi:predicted dehydrogenase